VNIINRTNETSRIHHTRDGRNIYSRGNPAARREISEINAIILHQTSFVSARVERFNYVIANYIVMQDGRVLMVRPIEERLNSIGTNQRAIDIEFVGNYPDARAVHRGGRTTFSLPSTQQIRAGRELVAHLRDRHGISKIFGHIQFRSKNCPGPHLWYNVGMWAVVHGLSSSRTGARMIPRQWQDESMEIVPLRINRAE